VIPWIVLAVISWWITFAREVIEPDRSLLVSDGCYYADIARSLARGEGYVDRYIRPNQVGLLGVGPPHPSSLAAPAYPALVALGFRAIGSESARIAVGVNLVGFLVALFCLHRAARIVLGADWAWIPCALFVLDVRIMRLAIDGLSEGWLTAFLVAAFAGLLACREAWAGVWFGLALLTRVAVSAAFPAFLAFALARRWKALRFVSAAGMTAGTWFILRWAFGNPGFELQSYNLFHDLGPWEGQAAYHTLFPPTPWQLVTQDRALLVGKIVTGLGKCLVLLPTKLFEPFELLLFTTGIALGWRKGSIHRALAVLSVLLLAGQAVVSAATLLEPRFWRPVGVLLFLPAAMTIRTWGQRARRSGLVSTALVVAFGASVWFPVFGGFLRAPSAAPRLTETTARAIGEWVRKTTPPEAVVLTDLEPIVWYGDRATVWNPIDPAELAETVRLTDATFALWSVRHHTIPPRSMGELPGSGPSIVEPGWIAAETAWRTLCEAELARGSFVPVDSLDVPNATLILASRARPGKPPPS